jgi:predicted outer membrane repeat protein
VFAIPGDGPFVIHLSSALVPTAPMAIDASTQPTYSGQPVVTLDGGDATQLVRSSTETTLRLIGLGFANAPDIEPEHNQPVAAVVASGDLEILRSSFTGNDDGAVETFGARLTVDGSRFEGNRREAILQHGHFTHVTRSEFRANGRAVAGAAIHVAFGDLLVEDSLFSGNRASRGGAISASGGSTKIVRSTFTDNIAYGGGAIFNSGRLRLERSTFAGNLAASVGTGLGDGGGLGNYGYATVSDSTFFGNEAGRDGGAVFNFGATNLVHVTVAENVAARTGGAVANGSDASAKLANTLVSDNSGPSCSGAGIVDMGGNLTWFDTTCPGISADPLLGPLEDNGGPTWTMMPAADSPAVDGAELDACTRTDQRRLPRPAGAGCDIGAVERQEPA